MIIQNFKWKYYNDYKYDLGNKYFHTWTKWAFEITIKYLEDESNASSNHLILTLKINQGMHFFEK